MSNSGVVHLIDDDDAVRDSLGFLLSSAGFEVHAYESADAFLQRLTAPVSGCVVTDVRMPGISGIELLREIDKRNLQLPVVVMTGHGDVPLAVEAMKGGAVDFIEKPFDDDSMLNAIRAALSHHANKAQRDASLNDARSRIALLSARERQVLEGLVAGHPNKVIAFNLGISPRTVEIYRANVMSKMQANSLSELVRIALTSGIIGSAGNG